jgi:tetratricopeptide (TPR) repeat protein
MAQDRAKQLLQQGIAAARGGQPDQARQLLQQAVRLDPQNESIWLWLSSVAKDDKERAFCLKQILTINPKNELALKGLQAMGVEPEKQVEAAPGVPVVAADKLAKLQTAVDEFLRNYTPTPTTVLEIEWVRKEKRRYGEGAARRLRTSAYAAIAAGVLLVTALLVVIALSVDLGGDATEARRVRASSTPTNTPTITPTATPGVPNTPTPESVQASTAVPIPVNLPAGSIYGGTPTPLYPRFDPAVDSQVRTAVAYYSIGQYDQAATISSFERTAQPNNCYPETYYYEAVGLAEQGGRLNFDRARELLTAALNRERVGNFASCQDSPLLYTGQCIVNYYQAVADPNNVNFNLLDQGVDWCELALAVDPQLQKASATLARIYLEQARAGQTQSFNRAIGVLNDALQRNPSNVELLLIRTEVELARGNPEEALVHVARALYVDPLAEEGLRLQAQAYLQLAAQASGNERILRYGRASIAAEQYLLYYPGKPEGHILLAEARLQEGNPDRAIFTVNRVIEARDSLPDSERPALIQAYELRARIYLERWEWQDAFNDLAELIALDPDNLVWVELQTQAARALGRNAVVLNNLETLLEENGDDPALILEKAKLLSQTCLFDDDLECEPSTVVDDLLTDAFVSALPPAQQADARAYRAEAEFALLSENRDLTESARATALEGIRQELEQALAVRETAEDYYLLAQVLAELGQDQQALAAYEWVVYWNQFYSYPFGSDAERAIRPLRDQIETQPEAES